ncbi:MAG TPA: hypothetical protein VJT73_07315 [Polyangiaceae bacterium]|nr:hypothetical protein [Polyangiaceae bacterium]
MPRAPVTIQSMQFSFSASRLAPERAERIAHRALEHVSEALARGELSPGTAVVSRLETAPVEASLAGFDDGAVADASARAVVEALRRSGI